MAPRQFLEIDLSAARRRTGIRDVAREASQGNVVVKPTAAHVVVVLTILRDIVRALTSTCGSSSCISHFSLMTGAS